MNFPRLSLQQMNTNFFPRFFSFLKRCIHDISPTSDPLMKLLNLIVETLPIVCKIWPVIKRNPITFTRCNCWLLQLNFNFALASPVGWFLCFSVNPLNFTAFCFQVNWKCTFTKNFYCLLTNNFLACSEDFWPSFLLLIGSPISFCFQMLKQQ